MTRTVPRTLPDAEALEREAARVVADDIRSARALRLVLAGGTTPLRCYQILAGMMLPWGRVSVLFGDERCLPPTHPESNYRMVSDALLARVAPAGVHRMPVELGAEEGPRSTNRSSWPRRSISCCLGSDRMGTPRRSSPAAPRCGRRVARADPRRRSRQA
jgi:6-phosphogluconolactonase/glucosamine-6-phosphate isomerase/deaminase